MRKTKSKMGKLKSGNKCENLVSKKLFYHNILELIERCLFTKGFNKDPK